MAAKLERFGHLILVLACSRCFLSWNSVWAETVMLFPPMPPSTHQNCSDYSHKTVLHGERYVPRRGDLCTSCTCHDGDAESCQSVLCSSPPRGCVALDDKCCEFTCDKAFANTTNVDSKDTDTLNTTNLGLRLVASTVTSFLILALLLFMIHRLRQRRLLLMIRRINGSQVSGGPYGPRRFSVDEDGSVGYLTGQDQVEFGTYDEPPPPYTFWKPPEAYFAHEEAPPPYELSPPPPPPPPPPAPTSHPPPPIHPSHHHHHAHHNSLHHHHHNNDRNRDNNAVNLGHHQQQQSQGAVAVSGGYPLTPPYQSSGMAGAVFPIHCSQRPGAFGALPTHQQHHSYAHSPSMPVGGLIPSLTQVSLRTNNFQMNNLDQESSEPNARRHSVPLNVVGSSRSSLNSSQSGELNESLAEPTQTTTAATSSSSNTSAITTTTNTSTTTAAAAAAAPTNVAIRSDAVYVGSSAGMIPPLVPTATTGQSTTRLNRSVAAEIADETTTTVATQPVSQLRTESTTIATNAFRDRPVSAIVAGPVSDQALSGAAATGSCRVGAGSRSCNDVLDGWQHADEQQRRWKRDVACTNKNRRSLQPRYYLDGDCGTSATAWLADGSVSSSGSGSSSSSPTYERGTLSPTSSDSSSIDYNFHPASGRDEKTSRPPSESIDLPGESVAASAATTKCASSRKNGSGSSLDRTLDALRAKISLKKKATSATLTSGQQQHPRVKSGAGNKLRHLLAGFGGGVAATTTADSFARNNDVLQPLNHRRCSTSEVAATAVDRGSSANIPEDDTSIAATSDQTLPPQRPRSFHANHHLVANEDEHQQPLFNRAPRISYVDNDRTPRPLSTSSNATNNNTGAATLVPTAAVRPRALNLDRRRRQPRPRSYDFADLLSATPSQQSFATVTSSATYGSIAEEGVASTPPTLHSDEPHSTATTTTADNTTDATIATTTDCCCSLGSDSSFACTCSSRASFGGSSGTVSREGPASPSDISPEVPPPFPSPPPPRAVGVPLSVLARSGSICSETGERRNCRHSPTLVLGAAHAGSGVDHQVRIESATVTALPTALARGSFAGVSTGDAVGTNAATVRSCSVEESAQRLADSASATSSGAAVNRIRVTVGRASNESFI